MSGIQFCLLAMTGTCAAVIVKQWKSDFVPLIRLGMTVLFAVSLLTAISPLISYIRELMTLGGIAAYAEPLLKALGIGILTQCCADICRDCGESSIGTGVETVGKAEILCLCLPLLREISEVAKSLLSLGGGL